MRAEIASKGATRQVEVIRTGVRDLRDEKAMGGKREEQRRKNCVLLLRRVHRCTAPLTLLRARTWTGSGMT